jgi:hypothetical protein
MSKDYKGLSGKESSELMGGKTLKQQYMRMESKRETYLNRARAASAITIPALIVPKGFTDTSVLPTPYQSMGARGVNNLASKLLLALLPPNQPFFKLTMDDAMREKLGAKVGDVEKALSQAERAVIRDIETSQYRPAVFVALKHLLVAGNVLTYDDDKSRALRVFSLTQFCVDRDSSGNVLKIIVKEVVSPEALPESIRDYVQAMDQMDSGTTPHSSKEVKEVELFTGICREDDKFVVWQEVNGVKLPDSEGSYPKDRCPWNAQRLILVEGEDYGRGYVEEFYGDLKSLEVLQRSMVQASAAAAKLVYLVNPNGVMDAEDLATAEGGDVIPGMEGDVTVIQTQKSADFNTVEVRIQKLSEALSYAFLLNSAVQRQAERVTAAEIQYMANELEAALGGIYSALSQEFQLPLVRSRMASMQRRGLLPPMPEKMVQPMVTTGVDAIGRGNDFEKLRAYIGFLSESLGPQKVAEILDSSEVANRAAAAMGINSDGLVKTPEQLQEEQQQMMQAQMAMQAVGPMAGAAAQAANAPAQEPPVQ